MPVSGNIKSVTWMLGTLASFCLMAIGARELSGQMDTFLLLFFRSVIGLLIISLIIVARGELRLFKTQRFKLHSVRNLFHFGGQYGWFLGITLLPLAEVFAIEFTVPLWTAIIAALFLGERFTFKKLCSIVLGMTGVMLILQPGIELIDPASFIVLGAAICYAISHSSTKSLSSTENPLTILFMMCLLQLPISLLFSLSYWALPEGQQWLWLSIIGVTALSAHFCMTKAMHYAEVSLVVTLDFLRLPIIAIVGVAFYSESFNLTLIAGAFIILLGNLINLYSPRIKPNIS